MAGRVLDFGRGSKPYQFLFTRARDYIGLDIENEGHSHAKEQIDYYYDGSRIPFGNESFDACFCSEVLEHVTDLRMTLTEIHRVLKKGAPMLVSVPFAWGEHETPNDFRRLSQYGVLSALRQAGFSVSELTISGHYIEVLFSLFIEYMRRRLFGKYVLINGLLTVLVLAPLTMVALLVEKILPKDSSLYFRTIVCCEKV